NGQRARVLLHEVAADLSDTAQAAEALVPRPFDFVDIVKMQNRDFNGLVIRVPRRTDRRKETSIYNSGDSEQTLLHRFSSKRHDDATSPGPSRLSHVSGRSIVTKGENLDVRALLIGVKTSTNYIN